VILSERWAPAGRVAVATSLTAMSVGDGTLTKAEATVLDDGLSKANVAASQVYSPQASAMLASSHWASFPRPWQYQAYSYWVSFPRV
jgi:hypothetical protein